MATSPSEPGRCIQTRDSLACQGRPWSRPSLHPRGDLLSTDEEELAAELRNAYRNGTIDPIRSRIPGGELGAAYRVQDLNTEVWIGEGRVPVGHKVGLTSRAVQQQLGVDQPDVGVLFADTMVLDGHEDQLSKYFQPKIEAEIALVLADAIDNPEATNVDVIRAVDFVVPAIEIVDSRIRDWDIGLLDTVADNASSAGFVLGNTPLNLRGLDLRNCTMSITSRSKFLSEGIGSACLGHPLNAAVWLARHMARSGTPLQSGEVLLTGALGPMVTPEAGEEYAVEISGLGQLSIGFT